MENDNINKFSFAQMTSNETGKTSGSGTMGVFGCILSAFPIIIGTIDACWGSKNTAVLTAGIGLFLTSVGLLAYRKGKEATTKTEDVSVSTSTTTKNINVTENN